MQAFVSKAFLYNAMHTYTHKSAAANVHTSPTCTYTFTYISIHVNPHTRIMYNCIHRERERERERETERERERQSCKCQHIHTQSKIRDWPQSAPHAALQHPGAVQLNAMPTDQNCRDRCDRRRRNDLKQNPCEDMRLNLTSRTCPVGLGVSSYHALHLAWVMKK